MKKALALAAIAALSAASAQTLSGAGASFPFPLYSKMFAEYRSATGVTVNYQSVGSGSGQRQILERTVDFAGSDNPMSNEQLAAAPGPLLHVPTAIGAVVPVYNIPGVTTTLRFDGPLLADIFLGRVRLWNDARVRQLNPNVNLPALPITVARRADGSGTTFVWTDYLSRVSSQWRSQVGVANSVQWPVGIAGRGNDGVANLVQNTPGAIGYVELAFAKQNNLPTGQVRNRVGNFVTASAQTASLSAQGAVIPPDTRVSIVNSIHPQSWPISSFTYVIFYREQNYGGRTRAQATALRNLLAWMVTAGQQYNAPLDYAPLPEGVVNRARAIILSMTFGGQRL